MKYLTNSGLSYFFNKLKTYISNALSSKANSTHTHSASDITSGLATVATSGSYNDLSNKPTIPTVNNATLTIQKNGTTVKTFTANASSNVTANITVPTKTSDLTNDSGFLTSHQDLSGYIPLSGTSALSGSIIPSTDNAYNLGSSSKAFNLVYASGIRLQANASTIQTQSDIAHLEIYGGTGWQHGSMIFLMGKNEPNYPGYFQLYASNGTDEKVLTGTPSGTLTWGTKNVAMYEDTIPRSGGAVLSGTSFSRTVNNSELQINGGTGWGQGASIALGGKDKTGITGVVYLHADDSTSFNQIEIWPNGNVKQNLNGTIKNVAMAEDVVPRSGGAVINGSLMRNIDNNALHLAGGSDYNRGADIWLFGKDEANRNGAVQLMPCDGIGSPSMFLYPSGTWTWTGQAVQLISDQRLKQQITKIDDKLLDAWEDVNLVQFKYNDAVDQKGDTARLHTGYVVQQIDTACKSHNVDISEYGLFCHEEYPEETEEVEVEQEDGTKVKERKVIREASEHYSLRYTEVYAIECAYLRKRIKELEERLEKLEGK